MSPIAICHSIAFSSDAEISVAVAFLQYSPISFRYASTRAGLLGSNLPVDDAPVAVAQVCKGIMHVQTVGRQQSAKKLDIC